MAKQVNTMAQTPRKLPFGDKTNNAIELLKAAVKSQIGLGSSSSIEKITKQEPAPLAKQQDESIFDFSEFVQPSDGNCYCCGDERKSESNEIFLFSGHSLFSHFSADGEVWGEKLGLTKEFIEAFCNVPERIPEFYTEPLSPCPMPERAVYEDESLEIPTFESLVNQHIDFSDSSEFDCSLTVPEEDEADESIINDW